MENGGGANKTVELQGAIPDLNKPSRCDKAALLVMPGRSDETL